MAKKISVSQNCQYHRPRRTTLSLYHTVNPVQKRGSGKAFALAVPKNLRNDHALVAEIRAKILGVENICMLGKPSI